MNNDLLSEKIMKKVKSYEQKKSYQFLGLLYAALMGLLITGIFYINHIYNSLKNQESLDLFTVFYEDMEIVRDYGAETLMIFFEELPTFALFVLFIVVLSTVIIWTKSKTGRTRVHNVLRILYPDTEKDSLKGGKMKKYLLPILISVFFVFIIFGYFLYKVNQVGDLNNAGVLNDNITPGATQKEDSMDTNKNILANKEIFLSVETPIDGAVTSKSFVEVGGKTVPSADVSINDLDIVSGIDGTFKSQVTLDEGENYIYIVVIDELGNFAEKEIVITYELPEE